MRRTYRVGQLLAGAAVKLVQEPLYDSHARAVKARFNEKRESRPAELGEAYRIELGCRF